MKRILMMVFRNLLFVPVTWFRLCYRASHSEKYTDYEQFRFLKYIVKKANRGGNVKIITSGQENIPEKDGFIYYPNHQGLYDVLAIVEASPRPLAAVPKKEIKDIPFLKQVLACMKTYTIDREDVRQAMQVIINVTNEVKKGRNFLLFAEGTRSREGNNTLEFKGGSFKAATKARCPIVPVALIDSFKPFDSNTTAPVTVQVHFLKPLYYDDYKDMKTKEIALLVRKQIQEAIIKHET